MVAGSAAGENGARPWEAPQQVAKVRDALTVSVRSRSITGIGLCSGLRDRAEFNSDPSDFFLVRAILS